MEQRPPGFLRRAGQEAMEIEKDRVQLLMDTGTDALSEGARQRVGVLHANIPIRSISNKGLF